MEELQSREVEDLLQELEEGDSTQESLPPDVENLLDALEAGADYVVRQNAAVQLGKVEASGERIIHALNAAYKSDPYPEVWMAAAEALQAPVHQAYLQENPNLVDLTRGSARQQSDPDAGAAGVMERSLPTEADAKMLKEVRSWGIWLLVIGAVSLVFSGLSGSWGVVLLVAGLASFVFREAPMFVVYGVILAWAAIWNLLSGEAGWMVTAAVQAVMAFLVFRKYGRYRRTAAGLESPPGPQRARRAFPQIGCALGAISVVGLVLLVVGAVIYEAATGATESPMVLIWLTDLALGLAVLGVAVATASLLSGFRHKVISILGLVASSSILLLGLGVALLV